MYFATLCLTSTPDGVSRRSIKGATINGVTYDGVAEFIYLGTLISNDNSVQEEVQRRILADNRTHFAAISLFRNRLLSRATKIRLYKTLMRPVLTYGAETWNTQELEGTRRRGRHRKGWGEEVERDLQVLGVRRWRELVIDKEKCRSIVRQAKAHSGL